MLIDEIIHELLNDFANNHYYEMYDIVPSSNVSDGLWVCIDEDDGAGNMVLRFDYNNKSEWVTCSPDKSIIYDHIKNAQKKFEEMLLNINNMSLEVDVDKVVLVMDKPKSCMFCPLIDGETGECKEGGIIEDNENPTYCPLRLLPKYVRDKNTFAVENKYMNYQDGYNACLDEILGGNDE